MKLMIVSPEKILFQGPAESVVVPGTRGQFEILENHAPIISTLQKGVVVYKSDGEHSLDILGGFVEVANNVVSLCIEA